MIFICRNCWKNRKKPPKIRTLTNFVLHGILIDPISGYRTHDIPIESQAHAPRQSWILDSTPWIPDSRYSCTRFQSLSVKFGFWILIVRVACSAGVFFERAICSRKRHVETSRREEEMGRVKGNGYFFSPLSPFPSFALAPTVRVVTRMHTPKSGIRSETGTE